MSAGDLDDREYARCEAIAWRLVMACIRVPIDGADGASLWKVALNEIASRDELHAVLEILAVYVANRVIVDCGGQTRAGLEEASRRVKTEIASLWYVIGELVDALQHADDDQDNGGGEPA
jgi:hypothetical protein